MENKTLMYVGGAIAFVIIALLIFSVYQNAERKDKLSNPDAKKDDEKEKTKNKLVNGSLPNGGINPIVQEID